MMISLVTGYSRRYGFVEVEESRSVEDIFYEANKSLLDGNLIMIDFERCRIMKGMIHDLLWNENRMETKKIRRWLRWQ